MTTKKKTPTKKATATAKAKPSKKKSAAVANGSKFQEIPIALIVSADNVRTERTDISDLAESIKAHGIINPITVHPDDEGKFIVVAGHRRLEAAKIDGLATVPCNIIEGSDKNILNEIAIQENVLRVDMTPYEECVAIKNLVGKGNTPRQIAARFGRTLRWVLVRVKLANAGDKVLNKVKDGSIRMANAAKLADLPDDEFNEEMLSVYRLDDYTTKCILERHHMDLKKAPFDTCDCSTCAKCSAQQQDLFAEETENFCLDPDCWTKKCTAKANEKKKEFESNGIIATVGDDGTNRIHKIESWEKKKIEQAEQAGIKKRVIIDPETCRKTEYYDERDLPDFREETEEEREQRQNEECRIKKFNKVKNELYCKNLSGAICTVTARNLGNHLITLLMFSGNEWFLKFAQENSWIDENEYNVYPENLKDQKTIEEIADAARNNINRIIEDFDANSLTAIFRMMFKDIDPETLKPFDYEVTAEIERQQAEENDENSDEDDKEEETNENSKEKE